MSEKDNNSLGQEEVSIEGLAVVEETSPEGALEMKPEEEEADIMSMINDDPANKELSHDEEKSDIMSMIDGENENGHVDYDGGLEKEVDSTDEESANVNDGAPKEPVIVELKNGDMSDLKKSDKEFNESEIQHALDKEDIEGGVVSAKSDGPTMSTGFVKKSNNERKATVEMKYELTGFTVEYKEGDNFYTTDVNAKFEDVESAKDSISNDKYLMLLSGRVKSSRIKYGMPVISNDERQLFQYSEGVWRRS